MFIVLLRVHKVLAQQISANTWNSLRKILFFSQQKSVPFGKGGGSQYGLTSSGWTWKAVKRKQMLVNEKKIIASKTYKKRLWKSLSTKIVKFEDNR